MFSFPLLSSPSAMELSLPLMLHANDIFFNVFISGKTNTIMDKYKTHNKIV